MTSFVTLDEAKIYCDIDPAEVKYNSILEMLSNIATEKIQSWLDRDIFNTQYNEKLDIGTDQITIQLHNYPVTSVEGVTNYTTTLTTDDYCLYSDHGAIRKVLGYWYEGDQKVEVSYHAGYETIPECIKDATLQMIKRKWNDRLSGNIKSFSGGGISYTRADLIMGFDPDIASSIAHLRRLRT